MKRILSLILVCVMLISLLPSVTVAAEDVPRKYEFKFIHAAHTTTASEKSTTNCKFEDSARENKIIHTLDTVAEGYDAWGYVAQSFPNNVAGVGTEGAQARVSFYRPGNKPENAVVYDPAATTAATALCFELVIDAAGEYIPSFTATKFNVGPIVDYYLMPKNGEITSAATLSSAVKAMDSKYKVGTIDACGASGVATFKGESALELSKGNYYLIMVPNGESETAAATAKEKGLKYHYFLPRDFVLEPAITYPPTPTLTYDFNMLDGVNINNVMLDNTNALYANTKGTWEYTGFGATWIKTQTSYGVNIGTTASVPYAAFKIKVPYAGKYSAKLIHHMNKSSGGKGDVYILPGNADMSSIDSIIANGEKKTVATNVSYYNSEGTNIFDTETNAKDIVFDEAGEYYLVFHATGTDNGTWGTYPHKLVLSGTDAAARLMYVKASVSADKLDAGATADVSVSGYMTDGTEIPANASVTYESKKKDVASVSASGKVTAIAMGNAEIEVTVSLGEDKLTSSVTVTVTEPLPPTVTLTYDFNRLDGKTPNAVMITADTANYLTTNGTWEFSGIGISNIKTQDAYGVYISTTSVDSYGAFKLNIPYAGKYRAKLTHYVDKKTGGVGEVFLVPADSATSAIASLKTNSGRISLFDEIKYHTPGGVSFFDVETDYVDITVPQAGEYMLIFNATGTESGYYGMYPHMLTLEGENKEDAAVMYLDAVTSKKSVAVGEKMELILNGWMTDGSEISDDVEIVFTPEKEGIAEFDGRTITGVSDGRMNVGISATKGGLSYSDSVGIIVDSDVKTGYKVIYNIGNVAKANVTSKPAFATLTLENNRGFWSYIANSQDQATPNWAFSYTNTGICLAQNRWMSFNIYVPVEGIYSMYVEHGMHTGGCDVGVYVSDGDKTDSPIEDAYLVGSFNTLDAKADNYKTLNAEPSYVANVKLKKGMNRVAFRAPRSSGDAYAIAGNIILDGGEKLWLMSADMDISEAGKITLSGILSDGTEADMNLATVKFTSSNPEVAEAPEKGNALKLRTLGTTTVTADIELDGAKLSISKEYTVTKLPTPLSGADAEYRFFERNAAWDPIGNPIEGFPVTDRKEDIRGITYADTGLSGEGNWQYNVSGPSWIPEKYAVFMYAGSVEAPTNYLRLQMPKDGDWLAFDIKIPAAGRYIAEFLYSTYYRAASASDIHIIPKNESSDTKEEIGALLSEENLIATVDYLDAEATDTYHAKKIELGDLEFDAAGEYILVFKRNDGGRGGYINPKMLTLYGVNGMHYANIAIDKDELEFGEIANVELTATRLDGSALTPGSYEINLTSSNPDAVVITDDGKIKAVGDGVATVSVTVTDDTGKTVSATKEITARDNTGIKEEKLSLTSPIYVDQKAELEWKVTMNSGNVLVIPNADVTYTADVEGVVSIDENGKVTGLATGSAVISAAANFKGEEISAEVEVEVIVDDRKTEPTYYTYDMREVVRENIKKYSWAKQAADAEYDKAEKYLDQVETIYYSMPGQGIPITIRPGRLDDPEYKLCRYCGVDVIATYGNGTTGGWVYDIVNMPWKIQCPECKRLFPSNDFEKLYELGRDQAGYYDADRAREANDKLREETDGKTDYLRNDLYPELWQDPTSDTYNKDPLRKDEDGNYYTVDGKTWGVDDGFGYRTGRVYSNGVKEEHMYIGTYLWNYFSEVYNAILFNSRAYVFTDDPKYGRAGAIILDRMADLFPGYDFSVYNKAYPSSDGGSGLGKLHGRIDDSDYAQKFALACDAFFPMKDDPQLVKFLSENAKKWGLENDKSTGDKIWDNWERGILDETYYAMQRRDIQGNFGMHQLALATAAIVRDREPLTSEMIEWVYATNTTTAVRESTGGDLMTKLIDVIDRDGMGDEAAPNYNSVWISRMYQIAEMLALYKGEGDFDLYKNVKFTQMFTSFMPVLLTESHTVEIGDTGGVASLNIITGTSLYTTAFQFLKDTVYGPKLANHIYMRNGYSTDGLNYGMYVRNPESIQKEIEEYIDKDFRQESEIMTGFGFAVLRGGVKTNKVTTATEQNTLRDIWMYFGRTTGHGHAQMLHLGMDAYGLNVAPDTGYPELTGFQPNRWQWVRTTVSHNTVTVNEREQKAVTGAYPLHFEDTGKVKVMDIEAPNAYDAAEEYRRTAVMIEANDDVSYTVDFFRIKGGDTHTYSFHSQAENAYPIEGINLSYQTEDGTPNTPYVGSYADVNWPVGEDPNSPYVGSYETVYPRGYSWMGKVRRDAAPESKDISVEFDVRDYRGAIRDSRGIKLRMTQVNDFVPSEVAIVGGYVPQSSRNTGLPKTLDYVLVHRKGKNLDTTFTTVLEPYKNERYLSDIEAVDVTVSDGEESENDAVRAVKVTHTSGRVDYVVYATNNAVTYNVGDVFSFRGIVGVYSVNAEGEVIYRYVTDGDIIGEATNAPASIKGTVAGYQKELSFENYIDVNMDCEDIEKLSGKYINIANDGVRNAVYKIEGASDNGDGTIRLDIGTISLIRGHRDTTDFESGYIYDIAPNQRFEIPMSFVDENLPVFDPIASDMSSSSQSSVTIDLNAESPLEGKTVKYVGTSLPRGMALDEITGVITWKPSASQVGKNHVVVTAVDSDGREKTVHFDITVYGSTTGQGSGAASDSGASAPTTPTPSTPVEDDKTDIGTDLPGGPSKDDGETENVRFVDLGAHAWAADSINALADEGIIKGTSENTFSPAANITRADFAVLMVRAFKLSGYTGENFSDVLDTDYFANELAIARDTGLVSGMGDNKFAPRNFLTRQDMMVMIYRAMGCPPAGGGLPADPNTVVLPPESSKYSFDDVSSYAKTAVQILIDFRYVNGKNGEIAPLDYTTRAEVAVLIKRLIDRGVKIDNKSVSDGARIYSKYFNK